MRLQMAGALPPLPKVILWTSSGMFDVAAERGSGYTNFEVMTIGGAGGNGGNRPAGSSTYSNGMGATGAGGGLHRAVGLLANLTQSGVPVVVGAAGADSVYNSGNPKNMTNYGGDGGTSSFDGAVCRASGGLGGSSVYFDSRDESGDGWFQGLYSGVGGVGNSNVPGGGDARRYDTRSTLDGSWDGTIGKGGAGITGFLAVGAYSGGRGSYLASDPTVFGPGGIGGNQRGPQPGGGAKLFPITGLATHYGSKTDGLPGTGAVAIRLTAT